MSNALTALKESLKKDLAMANKTLPSTGGRTISMKGKVFTLPNAAVIQGHLEAVILDYRNVNRLYPPYDPSNTVPPKCFAINRIVDDMAPHPDAPEPQAADCASCSNNEFGSAATGKGKACRNGVRLAVVPVDATAKTPVWEMFIPPTALKHWTKYLSALIATGMHPAQVVTKITFNPDVDYPQPVFGAMDKLDADRINEVLSLRQKAAEIVEAPMVKEE